jgi:lactate dehydrogenase-like 2-hydroxyacid dehydrogenase
MKIVVLDAATLGKLTDLQRIHELGQVQLFESTRPEERLGHIGDAEIVVTNKVLLDRKVLAEAKNLRLICITATGVNNVDLDYAAERGIEVRNAAAYSTFSVAQHTFSMLFQLMHDAGYYDQYVKSGRYSGSSLFTHYGPAIRELHGKAFGIIGLGTIGRQVARIATAFGARVSYFSSSGHTQNSDYPRLSLSELLESCDIVSIHAPLTDRTANLISSNELARMKETAILINVGRGGIVDEAALAKALENGKPGGACLDVFSHEPIRADNPLLNSAIATKLVLTPHVAWTSQEARDRLFDITLQNIREYLGRS